MNILAIESSCDETAAAVLHAGADFPARPDYQLLSNVVVSQIDIFKAYGGVIPEVAARSHLEAILPVVHQALKEAGTAWADIDHIAVTHTPGLLGSLLIGTLTARTLAILHGKPLYPVHHLKSHIYSALLVDRGGTRQGTPTRAASASTVGIDAGQDPVILSFPAVALVVSGGHTQLIHMSSHTDFQIIGTTRDDAVGECFDKVAKILGLPYPGGPAISQAAASGDRAKYRFPHPKVPGYDFSFSGLKTAVLRAVQKECNLPISHPSHDLKNHLSSQQIADFAASFEKTAVDILLEKLRAAVKEYPAASIVIAGGVSANNYLREKATSDLASRDLFCDGQNTIASAPATAGGASGAREANLKPHIFFPELKFAGDNAAMVALAAAYEISTGKPPADPYHLDILPRSPIA